MAMLSRWKVMFVSVVLGFVILAGLIPEVSAADFYKGKTLTFVVGFSPGGGFDTYTRLIGRHISKHIPGNPGSAKRARVALADGARDWVVCLLAAALVDKKSP